MESDEASAARKFENDVKLKGLDHEYDTWIPIIHVPASTPVLEGGPWPLFAEDLPSEARIPLALARLGASCVKDVPASGVADRGRRA